MSPVRNQTPTRRGVSPRPSPMSSMYGNCARQSVEEFSAVATTCIATSFFAGSSRSAPLDGRLVVAGGVLAGGALAGGALAGGAVAGGVLAGGVGDSGEVVDGRVGFGEGDFVGDDVVGAAVGEPDPEHGAPLTLQPVGSPRP